MLIYDSGAITAWNTPELMPDGGGGAIYFWYDSPDLSTFNVWVQHIDSSGNMLFPMNGAQASTNSSDRLHMYPSATYHPVGDQTFVFWVEENGGQTQYGLYGQLFSSTGERLWTDSGLELVPIGSSQISFVRALSDGDGIYVGYFTGAYSTALRTLRIGYDGLTVWSPVTLSAASLGSKGSLGICQGIWQSAIFAWSDSRNDSGIYAQNINQDGSLGPSTGISDESPHAGAGSLFVLPNPSLGIVTVNFTVEPGGIASLEVYDICGRLIKTLISGNLEQGEHSAFWDRSDRSGSGSAGVYFVRLRTGSGETVSRMVLL